VNYELAWDPEVHVHRIGRTARAGNSGLAISFCAPEEAQRANILSEMLQIKLNWMNAPLASAWCRWRPKWRRCVSMVKKPKCARGMY
jgi:ATP-independent RNA helicase DbpA